MTEPDFIFEKLIPETPEKDYKQNDIIFKNEKIIDCKLSEIPSKRGEKRQQAVNTVNYSVFKIYSDIFLTEPYKK